MKILEALRTSRLLGSAILIVAIAHLVFQLFVWLPDNCRRTDVNRDMVIYYKAAQRVIHHRPLYAAEPWYGPDRYPDYYLYPPQFAAVISPLGYLSYSAFTKIWYVAELVAFWVYAICLNKLTGRRVTVRTSLIWGLVLAITPGTYDEMSLGQVETMLCASYAIAFAGVNSVGLLACLTQVKPYGLYPLAMYVRSEPKAAFKALLTVAAGCALAVAATGVKSLIDWAHDVMPLVSQGTFNTSNISFNFAVLRLLRWLGAWHYNSGPLPVGPRIYLSTVGIAVPIMTAYFIRRRDKVLAAATTLVVAMLFSPLCWLDYVASGYLIVASAMRLSNRDEAA